MKILLENNKGVMPIRDKFMQNNFLFALQGYEGWIFGRTVNRRIMEYPFGLVDADGNAVDISASSHQAEVRFRDPRNAEKDLLYLSQTTEGGYPWFLHGAIGIWPPQINMYLRYPESRDIAGKFPNADPIRPSDGDNVSPLRTDNSPYRSPSDQIELVIPPLLHIGTELYNRDANRNHQPRLRLLFALYFTHLFEEGRDDDMISDIASRRKPATFLTMGFGSRAHDFGNRILEDWGVRPMSLDEAIALGGRGFR